MDKLRIKKLLTLYEPCIVHRPRDLSFSSSRLSLKTSKSRGEIRIIYFAQYLRQYHDDPHGVPLTVVPEVWQHRLLRPSRSYRADRTPHLRGRIAVGLQSFLQIPQLSIHEPELADPLRSVNQRIQYYPFLPRIGSILFLLYYFCFDTYPFLLSKCYFQFLLFFILITVSVHIVFL